MDSRKDNIDLPAIPIEIRYSMAYEIQRIRGTLDKKEWYREHGYNPILPKQLEGVEAITNDQIVSCVEEEFHRQQYEHEAQMLREAWTSIADRILQLQQQIPKAHHFDTVKVIITHYGMGGSYNYPTNRILINTISKPPEKYSGTLAHESVHLMIEGFILTHGLKQWAKERIVDLTVAENFPELKHIQRGQLSYEEGAHIAKLFNSHYPDIEEVCKQLSEAR